MSPCAAPQVAILLVEDSLIDVRLTTEGLATGHVPHQLHVVRNGEDALAFLRREAPYADAPRPALILLDLHLPGKDGHEVLAEIKADARLRGIPICVLTASADEAEIQTAYRRGAACCITKSMDAGEFMDKVRQASNFWLAVARLPSDR